MRLDDDADIVVPNSNYKQYFQPTITQLTSTSIQVRVSGLGMPLEPANYKVIYQRVISRTNAGGYSSTTINNSLNPKTITGLVEGALYKITTQALGPSGEQGNSLTVYYKMTGTAVDPAINKGGANNEKINARSYLELQGGRTADDKYTYAYRDFDAVQVPTVTEKNLTPGKGENHRDMAPSYPNGPYYFSFGTSFVFPPLSIYEPQEAGIGFFLSGKGESGYYVTFATSATAAARNRNAVRIMKVSNKQIKVLKDDQKGKTTTLDELFSGSVHNVDIKVKVGANGSTGYDDETVTITVYINGFEITATDVNSPSSPYNKILPVTKKVGLLAASGRVGFDYVYATSINADQYNIQSANNLYTGQFSSDYLLTQYGDILYNAENDDDTVISKDSGYDEFGTVAREIVKRDVVFGGGAAMPNSWTAGGNSNVRVLAQDKSNFGASVFVLNNTSTVVPLADEGVNTLAIWGYKIGFSGDIEYTTDASTEYAVKEPIVFESTWLQNQEDVEKLAGWIQSRIVNKAKIINMTVFGNPLISVGDIVTVKYPYHGFVGTEKIIVTHVTHSYNEGLITTIRGRTI